jgi:tetratricopeptide (TPR) repeat protein
VILYPFEIIVVFLVGGMACLLFIFSRLKKEGNSSWCVSLFLGGFIGGMTIFLGLKGALLLWCINKYLSLGSAIFFVSLGFIVELRGATYRGDKVLEYLKRKSSDTSQKIKVAQIAVIIAIILLVLTGTAILRIKKDPEIMLKKANSTGTLFESFLKSTMDKRNLDKAIQLYCKVIKKYPNTEYAGRAYEGIAEIYGGIWIKDHKRAIEELKKAKDVYKKLKNACKIKFIESKIEWHERRIKREKGN